MSKTVFLDRDGTIIVDKDYLFDPALVELEDGAGEGLSILKSAGFQLVVVTNQSGVGRGYFDYDAVLECNKRIDCLLSAFGVSIDLWLICPHSPDEGCSCRKPQTGLISQAEARLTIDKQQSYVIGDKDTDLLLAQNGRLGGILVSTGSGKKHQECASSLQFPYMPNLLSAAKWIIRHTP